ncbi:ABC transporter substrate-binding protein [Paenibacillus endoradicis]|uniref:ABC transporter substrate-binding protein n=1 Tax=Paenibacillus endoradicis TaxID=2972487 RepID=UPI0021596661|nr:extracellular solute-binding protein [Paenibacillus endoradicis]MCR8655921.1 extracellular solute-binding protein [Paenibacillus endoradicis]MCR8658247.1 extracellular solute-binding protein [Paenibacillus endoradicis]
MLKKQRLLILLCLVFVLVVSACSGNTGGGNSGNNAKPDTSSKPVVTEDVSNEDVDVVKENPNATPEMDFDLGGKTVKIVAWFDLAIKQDGPDNIQRQKNLDALMEKHNFKVEYVALTYDEYVDKVSASMLANDPVGDILLIRRPWAIPSMVQQDFFWPLDEYTKNDKAFSPSGKKFSEYEGKTYGFSIYDGDNGANGIIYNKTLMNELGLKPLQEYVDEDNWNWDTFLQVAKEGNKDTNNDGKIDVWGLANVSIDAAMASNGADFTNGNQQALDDPKTIEVFNHISTFATEKLVRPTEGGDWTEPTQFFRQGNTLLVNGAMYEIAGYRTDMPDSEIGFVPYPKSPSATEYTSVTSAPTFYVIPKAVEHPEQMVYIMEKIQDYESVSEYSAQAYYESIFDNEEDVANLRTANKKTHALDRETYPSFPYWEILGDLNNGVSVSTVVETYKAKVQAAVDEVWLKK